MFSPLYLDLTDNAKMQPRFVAGQLDLPRSRPMWRALQCGELPEGISQGISHSISLLAVRSHTSRFSRFAALLHTRFNMALSLTFSHSLIHPPFRTLSHLVPKHSKKTTSLFGICAGAFAPCCHSASISATVVLP